MTTRAAWVASACHRVAFGPADVAFQPGQPGPLGVAALTSQFSTPFFYNPAGGNLLMDGRMFDGLIVPGVTFDASSLSTDQTSVLIASDRDSLTGGTGTIGLITGFSITPGVPEPSSIVLLIAAVIVFSLFGRRKNKQQKRKE